MAQVSNLNVQVNQNQVTPQQLGAPVDAGRVASPLSSLRTGTLVEGRVLSQNSDGTYTVQINAQGERASQTLLARATLPLIVGEHFRAVWDASGGGIPTLRLSPDEFSFLGRLPAQDRELGMMLLSRGLPLSDEVLLTVRDAWRRMGALPDQLPALLELWARGAPLNQDNVRVLSWFLALNSTVAAELWQKVRREVRERSRKGEDPVKILRELREGDDEVGYFLRGQSLFLRSPREGLNPILLGAAFWPAPEDQPHLTARVFVGRSRSEDERRYWQVGFGVEGARLGFIGGNAESDGRACNLTLYADRIETCELLKRKRHSLRRELETLPLPLQYLNISQSLIEELRRQFMAGRGLDITI
ncbi:MAG: hypothetical protein GX256_03050 [Fretibacterium sp.]|nr:hypothetical protein [Fretibacterium sp.]